MKRIHLYFRQEPQKDRYFPGDRYLFALARKLFRKKKASGLTKVFEHLCKGFDLLQVPYVVNQPFKKIQAGEPIIMLGLGKYTLEGYKKPYPVIAGIGLMTHPSEWPSLFHDYPVRVYLQHSIWAKNIYIPYFGEQNCDIWPAGIDTEKWKPAPGSEKKIDVLIYNKIMWNKNDSFPLLREPIIHRLKDSGLTYQEITYGEYNETEYFNLLQKSRAMIFLCEHESQGFACCEALAMNVSVLAWNQGYYLDPQRFEWKTPVIPATSIPFFDERCGSSFIDINDFEVKFKPFWENILTDTYQPRKYILENLTLEKSAQRMLEIIEKVYGISNHSFNK